MQNQSFLFCLSSDIAGKAEAIRLACHFSGLPLKDTRLTRDEFDAMKASGELPYGQVPLLVVDGKHKIAQSAAIIRFIGKLSGLYPVDPITAAMTDSLLDEEIDLFMGLSVSRYRERFGFGSLSEDSVSAVRRALNDEVLPKHLGFFERVLENSPTGWLCGTENPCVADFVLVPRLQWLASGVNDGISLQILDPFPRVKGLIDSFMALEKIQEYYRK